MRADASTLTSIVQAAIGVTGALDGWLLVADHDQLVVVASAAGDVVRLGVAFPAAAGSAGFAAASGQPVARRRLAGDSSEAGSALSRWCDDARSVLAVPCAGTDGVLGVLELAGKSGGGNFSIDDVELVSVLAGIAASALLATSPAAAAPSELAERLTGLAQIDPDAFAALSAVVDRLAPRRAGVTPGVP